MSEIAPTSPSAVSGPECRLSKSRLIVRFLGRISASAILLVLGFWVLGGTSRLFHAEPAENDSPPESKMANSGAVWPDHAFPAGGWSFAGVGWQISTRTVTESEAAAALEAPPPSGVEPRPCPDLLQIVKSLRADRSVEKETITYRIPLAGGRAVIATRLSGLEERVALCRIAWPMPGSLRLMEAVPTAEAIQASPELSPDWFPLPPGSRTLAVRRDQSGTEVGRLVLADAPPDLLLNHWEAAGVRNQPAPGTGSTPRAYVSRFRDRVVSIILWPTSSTQTLVLMAAMPAGVSP